MDNQFSHLMSPGYIGKVEIKNRIVSAPMMVSYAARDGSVTPRLVRYYANRAKGGTGLIIVEFTYIDQIASQTLWNQLAAYDTACVGGLTLLARAIHDWGSKCAVQLGHAGTMKNIGPPYWGPSDAIVSAMPFEMTNIQVTGMNRQQMDHVIEAFAAAAVRVKDAGFDMIEFHAAHGYLLSAFLSPHHNKRTDEYGGSVENRLRFILEIIKACKKRVGPSFPLTVRISGTDYEPVEPLTLDDSLIMAKMLEDTGVAAIHVSGGTDRIGGDKMVAAMTLQHGYNVYLADAVKNKSGIKIPVIAGSCSITTPAFAEEILSQGKADFVGLGRPSLADPEWGRKIEEGCPEDVVPCIRCNHGCTGTPTEFMSGRIVSCAVNPTFGCEDIRQVAPLERKKRVAIIGAGPAGMEASRLATVRGHDVTLYEKRELGGALIEGSWDKALKSDIQNLLDYYRTQMKKLNVNVIRWEATADNIVNGGYDAAIVATGAVPQKLDVPGIDKPHVYTDLDVLRGKDKELGTTVIVACTGRCKSCSWVMSGFCLYGQQIAAEIALSLALKGKKVILTGRWGGGMGKMDLAMKCPGASGMTLLEQMEGTGNVEINPNLILKEITDDGIVCDSVWKGRKSLDFKGDSVVICTSRLPDDALAKALKGKVKEVRSIGDCVEPRYIFNAIHEGWVAANQI